MRSVRVGSLFCFSFLAIPALAQQTSATSSSPQPASDPQAVAILQAAITALGGAAAISQAQSWTFQASVAGPIANGNVGYTVSTAVDTTTYTPLPNGLRKPAPLIRSLFVPVAIGSVLLAELQDPEFTMKYRGPMTVASKNITVVDFYVAPVPFAAQVWCFDATTNLPISIDFRLPAQMGQRLSFQGIVDLSDYRAVSGVLHPFRISTQIARSFFPEVVTIRSVAPSSAIVLGDYDASAGDLAEN